LNNNGEQPPSIHVGSVIFQIMVN